MLLVGEILFSRVEGFPRHPSINYMYVFTYLINQQKTFYPITFIQSHYIQMPSSQLSHHKKSSILFIIVQCCIIALYVILPINIIPNFYKQQYFPTFKRMNSQYMWVQIAAVIGFGLITGIARNMYFLSFAFIPLIYAFTFELYFLFDGLFWQAIKKNTEKFSINNESLINAGEAAIAMIICYGVVAGRISSFGIFYICVVGVAGYTFLKNFIYQSLAAFDIAKGLLIHTYGSLYGLVMSYCLSKSGQTQKKKKKNRDGYFYQHIAALGFLFLFVLFPILNSANNNETVISDCRGCQTRRNKNHEHQRLIIMFNTLFGLFGSLSAALVLTWTSKIKFNQIIFSGLAGGVISACIANFIPYHSVFYVFGFFGAIITKASMEYLQPLLEKYGIEDGRWCLSMHAIPGILSSIFSILLASLQIYMKYKQYEEYLTVFPFPKERYGSQQAKYQFLALIFTLFMSLVAGFAAAVLIKGFLPALEEERNDAEEFQIPDKEYFQPFPMEIPDDIQMELKYGII